MVVWQQSFEFAKGCLTLSKNLPSEERFGLSSQLGRAAVAMPAQIAQGQKKFGKEFVRHLSYAQGHAAECETYLMLLEDMFPNLKEQATRLRETNAIIQKMIGALSYAIDHPKNKKSDVSTVATSAEPVRVPVTA